MEFIKLKNIATYPTGKLNSNAAVEEGQFPFFTCAHEIYSIDRYAYDGEYVLLGGNNASGDFPIFYYNGKFEAYQRTYLIQPLKTDEYDTHYLFYAIGLKLAQMKNNAAGTATKFLTQPILDNIIVPKRDIEEQKKIVSVLSTYDSLIELNNKRIKLLEQMAENLYKEWFVRFRFPGHENAEFENGIPKGWTVSGDGQSRKPKIWHYGTLSELGVFVRGKNITAEQMEEGTIPVISAGIQPSGYHKQSNVDGYSMTISGSGANAGYLSYHLENIWAADCSYYNSENNFFFVLNSLRMLQPVLSNMQAGSAQPHVYPKDINKISIIIPDDDMIKNYCEIVAPMYDEIKVITEVNKGLVKQLDLLLPRLMSGKLEV